MTTPARILRIALDGPDMAGKTYTIRKMKTELEALQKMNLDIPEFRIISLKWPSEEFRKTSLWKDVPLTIERGVTIDDIEQWAKAIILDMAVTIEHIVTRKDGRKIETLDNLNTVILEDRSIVSTIVYQYARYLFSQAQKTGAQLNFREVIPRSVEINFIRWFYWVQSIYNMCMDNIEKDDYVHGVVGTLIILKQTLRKSSAEGDKSRNNTPTDEFFEKMAPLVNDLFTVFCGKITKDPERYFSGLYDIHIIDGCEGERKENADFATLAACGVATDAISRWFKELRE